MISPYPFTCDICGTPKKESNHWWLARPESPCGLRIEPWDEAEAILPDIQHLCGEGCVLRALTAWMQRSGSVADLERMMQ
jgi:hypothetical protein